LLVIHEMIKKKGHNSKYVHIPIYKHDFAPEYYDHITSELIKVCANADLLAFTCMTNTFLASSKLITRLKSRLNNIPVVIGGIHSTAKPLECLSCADYACIGEGERAFMELIDRIASGRSTKDTPGFYVKHNGKIIKNKSGELVKDLDTLPIPSFDLRDQYFIYNDKLICMNDYKDNQEVLMQYFTRYYFMVTSRGCPYTCKFCINDVLKRLSIQYRLMRYRSTAHVMEELNRMKSVIKYPVTIGFADDDFLARPVEKVQEFVKVYKKEIGLPFFHSSTPHSMHPDKIKASVDAGLRRIEIGIQSIHDATNRGIYGRAGLRKDVEKAISIVSPYRNKIEINYDIILDNPWESEESVLETLEFMFKIPKPCTFAIFSLVPFPGTSLYELAKEEGTLQDQEKLIYNNDIMLLKNNDLNTLITLYSKYHLPATLIKFGIKLRKTPPFSTLLKRGTIPLWRLYNYYEGFKTSLGDKNMPAIKSYLKSPILKAGKELVKIFNRRTREDLGITSESMERSPDGVISR
ncbi:MAG: radical SAM protein, partial [Nanoarchaeota archaeon]